VLADSFRFQKPTNAKPETVIGKLMGEPSIKYEEIIRNGKISASDIPNSSPQWVLNLILIIVSIWGLYYVNTKWEEQQLIVSIFLVVLLAFSIYQPIQSKLKLRVTFYEDEKSVDHKIRLIQKQKEISHWELLKSDKNYFLFFENNLIIQSYYITIVIDQKGFYINCYPNKGRVVDFGRAQRWSDQLYEDIKACR